MALQPINMTRSSSSDSSALSNILVAQVDDSASELVPASTPTTSLNESVSMSSSKRPSGAGEELSRPKRQRSGVSTYNIKQLSEATGTSGSRNTSGLTGKTLVDEDQDEDDQDDAFLGKKGDFSGEVDREESDLPKRKSPAKISRKPSVKDRMKRGLIKVGSVLGKRRRDVNERKLNEGSAAAEDGSVPMKIIKELDTGKKGVLDELDLDDDTFVPPAKRPKTKGLRTEELSKPTAAPVEITIGKHTKNWLNEGLFVGQDVDADPTQKGGRRKLQKKDRPDSAGSSETTTTKRTFMTLPMFNYLDKERSFVIPFDVYAPMSRKGDEKPKDWAKLNKNRLVGNANKLSEKATKATKATKLASSVCVCTAQPGRQGCEDDCLNVVMQYECNYDNCNLPASQCKNRAFADLAARTKKNGLFDIGVEVVKTYDRGFGVKACRTFDAGQIIMEYTGELIDEQESRRRMQEEYKDKQCYYLMELEGGLIIDGTRGSMARFVNHSCEPNCDVKMLKVKGMPRMAVFAGKKGVMTGEELTYDYNFNNFSSQQQKCYCGAPKCRGTLSKRLNAVERKKQQIEEAAEMKRKAVEEQQRIAELERRKKVKTDRGSNWRGWVAVDDPETKERLRAEKREREEAEKNSIRAKRLAARRGSLPGAAARPAVLKKSSSRRKTTNLEKTTTLEKTTNQEKSTTGAEKSDEEVETADAMKITKSISRTPHTRTVSSGSKFKEELDRPSSPGAASISTITKKTEMSISMTEVREEARMPLLGRTTDEPSIETTATDLPDAPKGGLSRTASKGKEVMRSFGEVVKKSFEKAGTGSVKMRQSTLSFAKKQ